MFVSYEVSVELVSALRPLVAQLERADRNLGDQMRRAATSVVLNLAEGSRSAKGNKRKHFALANGSANEVKAALQLAFSWGLVDEAERPLAILDRLLALLWKLTHSKNI